MSENSDDFIPQKRFSWEGALRFKQGKKKQNAKKPDTYQRISPDQASDEFDFSVQRQQKQRLAGRALMNQPLDKKPQSAILAHMKPPQVDTSKEYGGSKVDLGEGDKLGYKPLDPRKRISNS